MITTGRIRRSIVALAGVSICGASIAQETTPDPFRIAVGAYHWFNLPRHDGDVTYGSAGLPDTYRWEALVDAAHRMSESRCAGSGASRVG
jgi:hypothetical protein